MIIKAHYYHRDNKVIRVLLGSYYFEQGENSRSRYRKRQEDQSLKDHRDTCKTSKDADIVLYHAPTHTIYHISRSILQVLQYKSSHDD